MDSISQECLHIPGRKIGPGQPVFVIAEISANHNQDFEMACKLVEEAHKAGADAVKLQTFTPSTMTLKCDKEPFRIKGGTLWDGKSLYDLYEKAYTPWEWQPKLKTLADKLKIPLFSSAFDSSSVDFLEELNVCMHKVASPELVDLPLIKKLAATKKPLLISTGMANLLEIEDAVGAARKAGATEIAVLKCTSVYPAPPDTMNLRTIEDLAKRFRCPVGLSDHTPGTVAPVVAVAMGASIIEKHFILSRTIETPDRAFSVEPAELKVMIENIREAEQALGVVSYKIGKEEENIRNYRRSLFAVEEIKAGELFTEKNIRSIRPAAGLPPKHYFEILGKKAKANIERGTPLNWDLVD
jgi:pseudaminic acid synthase